MNQPSKAPSFRLYLPRPSPRPYDTGICGVTVADNVPAPALLYWIEEVRRRFGERPEVLVYGWSS